MNPANTPAAIRHRYGLNKSDVVCTLCCNYKDKTAHEACIAAVITFAQKHPDVPVHCFLLGNADEQQQPIIDKLVHSTWLANLRHRFHVYTTDVHKADILQITDVHLTTDNNLTIDTAKQMLVLQADADDAQRLATVILPTNSPVETPSNLPGAGISLVMRASRPDTVYQAITAAIATFPMYEEFIIAISPTLPDEVQTYVQQLPRVRTVPGTSVREEAAALHTDLLGMATSPWIANVDDDDLWVHAPPLNSVPDDIGIIHGQYLYFNYYLNPQEWRYISLEEGGKVEKPAEANNIVGSNWLMRKAAWESARNHIPEGGFRHSDWRTYYTIVKQGWRTLYIPRVLGLTQRFFYDSPMTPESKWQHTVSLIESGSPSRNGA